MIIGNKEYKVRVLKDITEVGYENLICFKAVSQFIGTIAGNFLDLTDDRYFKDDFRLHDRLEIGSKIRAQRWDWNGIDEEEVITEIIIIDEFSAKIKTKKGKVIFDTREKYFSKMFKWNNKQKNSWIRENMQNVDFTYKYIETE